MKPSGPILIPFIKSICRFELTNAQKRVLKEIRIDMDSNAQMNRLLQGDVGSGKTIVALMSMLIAIDNNFQATLMAPTEILSFQHYNGLKPFCDLIGVKIGLLTGSSKTAARRLIHEQLESGELQIIIGTHALLEDKVKFKNLGLAIIDEQHRFGVAQRQQAVEKKCVASTYFGHDCHTHPTNLSDVCLWRFRYFCD